MSLTPSPETVVEIDLDPEPLESQHDQSMNISVMHDQSLDLVEMTNEQLNMWAFGMMKDQLNTQGGTPTVTCGKASQYAARPQASQAQSSAQWVDDHEVAIDRIICLQDRMMSIGFLQNSHYSPQVLLYNQALKQSNMSACTYSSKSKSLEIPIINARGEIIQQTWQTYTVAYFPRLNACRDVLTLQTYKDATEETPELKPGQVHTCMTMKTYMNLNVKKMKGSWDPEEEGDITNC